MKDCGHSADRLSPDAIRRQAECILASRQFAAAGRLAQFLRYIIDRALAGETGRLKETIIGIEAFGKAPDYDPRIDPAVRVAAGRVRTRLQNYYAGDGRFDSLIVELPVGSYLPLFGTSGASNRPAAVTSPPEPAAPPKLAVLPFENLSETADREFFADGMTELLIVQMAKISGLRVISRTSIMQYKRVRKPLPLIGAELGVSYVLEGTVMWARDRVRVSAQLIEAASDSHLWAEVYESDVSDVHTLQSRVAHLVAREVRVRLGPEAGDGPQVDRAAFECYLRARHAWNHGRWHEAVPLFEKAVTADSMSALARFGLAEAYFHLAKFGNQQQYYPKARMELEAALRLDPSSAEALALKGNLLIFADWNFVGGEEALKRSIELSPSCVNGRTWYAEALLRRRQFDAAMQEMERALELDPYSPYRLESAASLAHRCGRDEKALEYLDRGRAIDPDLPVNRLHRALSLVALGRISEAVALFSAEPLDPDLLSVYGLVCGLAGHRHKATAALERLRSLSEVEAPVSQFGIGTILFGLEQFDECLTAFERAMEEKNWLMTYLAVTPGFESLRGHPRFKAMLSRLP